MNYIGKVEEFHILGGQPVLEIPQIPEWPRCTLRVNLIQEELDELEEALTNGDLVEVIDALCDLQYVLSGSVLETGFKSIFDLCFDEVHRSNMTKSCDSYELALSESLMFEHACLIDFRQGRYVILHATTKKLLKPSTYSPANLRPIIENFLKQLN